MKKYIAFVASCLFFSMPEAFSQKSGTIQTGWGNFDVQSGLNIKDFGPLLQINNQPADSLSKFRYSRPLKRGSEERVNDVHSMMPVYQPKGNSKILLAKIDTDFPFRYNMPVKKTGTQEPESPVLPE